MRERYRQPPLPQPSKRLRKQPRMRRMQAAAVPIPRMSVPKTARQRRQRNRRRVRLPISTLKQFIFSARWISLGLLSLMVYALILIGMDTGFYLTLIPVEGTFSIPAAEIVEASGLAGEHVFAADPNQAATQITQLPGIVSATVSLSWPNEVLIKIKEDSPIAVWQEGGQDFWVTKDGRLVPARIGTMGLLYIESEVVTTPATNLVPVGGATADVEVSTPFVPPEVLAGALQLRELRPNIEKLYYRPSSGLSYQDGRGWRVYFGTGTDMAQKLVVYETIVEDLMARGLVPVYISVSNQQKPYYLAQGGE